jgi:hypothetical protein
LVIKATTPHTTPKGHFQAKHDRFHQRMPSAFRGHQPLLKPIIADSKGEAAALLERSIVLKPIADAILTFHRLGWGGTLKPDWVILSAFVIATNLPVLIHATKPIAGTTLMRRAISEAATQHLLRFFWTVLFDPKG